MTTVKIQTGLRLEETAYNKLKALSEQEGRSLNNLAEYIIRQYLANYEREHGPPPESQDQQP